MKHTPRTFFFPGNNLLLEKTVISTTCDDAKDVQLQVGSDLTTMRTFGFDVWRSIIASRYAADPLVTELLKNYERLYEATRGTHRHAASIENSSLSDKTQTWQSIFP